MDEATHAINIGPGQRTGRYVAFYLALIVTLLLRRILVVSGAHRLWRLVLYPPLVIAIWAFFEAKTQTCVVLAHRGECSLDQGFSMARLVRGDQIQDSSLVAQLRRQARQVTWKTQALAIGLTLLLVVFPGDTDR